MDLAFSSLEGSGLQLHKPLALADFNIKLFMYTKKKKFYSILLLSTYLIFVDPQINIKWPTWKFYLTEEKPRSRRSVKSSRFVKIPRSNHREPTQSVCVTNYYFMVNVLDLLFVCCTHSVISLIMHINQW